MIVQDWLTPMPRDQLPLAFAVYEALFAEITKLLAEMQQDAQAHGFDVGPYFDRLALLADVSRPRTSRTPLN